MGIFDTSDLLKKDFHVKYVEFKFWDRKFEILLDLVQAGAEGMQKWLVVQKIRQGRGWQVRPGEVVPVG